VGKKSKEQPDIGDGKIIDFIDGTLRKDSETEQIRQNFERTLIEEYNYLPEDVAVDFKIKVMDGTKNITKTVSLAVFDAKKSTKTVQDDVYILIAIAKPKSQPSDISGGTEDLERLLAACVNTTFACWTNGVETLYFQKKKSKFDADIFPVNDFPRKGEDASSIYTTDRSRLRAATGNNLLSAFKRCHDFIHANQGGSKEQIFWEFLKILFAKIEDEQHDGRPRFAIRNADERNTLPGQKEVKDRVESLFREVRGKSYKGLFDDVTEDIIFQPNVVAYIVAQMEKYDFLHSSVDVKGMAYETIVGPTLEGTKGEFFTPRNVVKMTVKMLDPKPGDRILDPACGTGGFIVVAFNYISEKIRQAEAKLWKNPKKPTRQEEKALFDKIHEVGKSIFGLDFNANLVKTAQMNMIMNNDGRGGLYSVNSLQKPIQWTNKQAYNEVELGSMDFVMANPPFGANLKIEGQEILEQYDLAQSWKKQGDRWVMEGTLKLGVPPEVLFIERCVQFLKPGKGKLGIVLPDGILGNPDAEYIRYWILSNCQVLASIDLPVETFLPRTGTQTSVLILRRKSEQEKLAESLSGEPVSYQIFMAIAKFVGKDRRGNIIYKKDQEGREIVNRELYELHKDSTIIDFSPSVEPNGRIVNDDLPAIASTFIQEIGE
jgi:type I restriction enzyme M protein